MFSLPGGRRRKRTEEQRGGMRRSRRREAKTGSGLRLDDNIINYYHNKIDYHNGSMVGFGVGKMVVI